MREVGGMLVWLRNLIFGGRAESLDAVVKGVGTEGSIGDFRVGVAWVWDLVRGSECRGYDHT